VCGGGLVNHTLSGHSYEFSKTLSGHFLLSGHWPCPDNVRPSRMDSTRWVTPGKSWIWSIPVLCRQHTIHAFLHTTHPCVPAVRFEKRCRDNVREWYLCRDIAMLSNSRCWTAYVVRSGGATKYHQLAFRLSFTLLFTCSHYWNLWSFLYYCGGITKAIWVFFFMSFFFRVFFRTFFTLTRVVYMFRVATFTAFLCALCTRVDAVAGSFRFLRSFNYVFI
jgi:hypothetical protein